MRKGERKRERELESEKKREREREREKKKKKKKRERRAGIFCRVFHPHQLDLFAEDRQCSFSVEFSSLTRQDFPSYLYFFFCLDYKGLRNLSSPFPRVIFNPPSNSYSFFLTYSRILFTSPSLLRVSILIKSCSFPFTSCSLFPDCHPSHEEEVAYDWRVSSSDE